LIFSTGLFATGWRNAAVFKIEREFGGPMIGSEDLKASYSLARKSILTALVLGVALSANARAVVVVTGAGHENQVIPIGKRFVGWIRASIILSGGVFPCVSASMPISKFINIVDVADYVEVGRPIFYGYDFFWRNSQNMKNEKFVVADQKCLWKDRVISGIVGCFWQRGIARRDHYRLKNYICDVGRRLSDFFNRQIDVQKASIVLHVEPGRSVGHSDVRPLSNAGIVNLLFGREYQSNGGNYQCKRSDSQHCREKQEPPIGRRFLILVASSLLCLWCSWGGWQNFYNKRRLIGTTWFTVAALVWFLGVGLWLGNRWEITWGWIV
jgi:hypothetical protein